MADAVVGRAGWELLRSNPREHPAPARLLRSLQLGLAVLVLAACRRASPEIRIGLLATTTGTYAEASGIPTVEGARLAVQEAGPVRIDGVAHRVVLIERSFDDRADAAGSAARALINQDQVVAIIGPQFSRHAIPASVIAENAGIPMISPMSSNPATTAGKSYVFRLAYLDDFQGEVLARAAIEELRASRAAVLYDVSTAYSRGLAERFRRAFTSRGGRVVAFESYTADRAASFKAQLARIRASRPDVLLLPNFPDAVNRQLAQAESLGLRVSILGSDSWDPPALYPLQPGQRALVTSQWAPGYPTPATRRFVATYRRVYGSEPRSAAAMTYDAVRILLAAIARAQSLDPDRIRQAIADTRNYEGTTGRITFAGNADPERSVPVSAVVDGQLSIVRVVDPP